MKLNEITEGWLKTFAGEKIFKRGEGYFQSGMVHQIEYHPDELRIQAEVSGNYGNYDVGITEGERDISAYCDCPYDGYPCKHIIAVLLHFLKNREEHVQQAEERKNFFASLEETLGRYSHEQLIRIIVEAARLHPDFKRELAVIARPDDSETLSLIMRQLRCIHLDDFEDDYGSESEKRRELKKIIRSVEHAGGKIQATVNWEVADKVLDFLNRYGVSDEQWEDLLVQTFENLSAVFSKHTDLNDERMNISEQLDKYYTWGNCGMTDEIAELIEELNRKE